MNDLKPFKHGEEGTHSVCNKHNIGGKSICCKCSGEDDCGDEPMKSKQNASEHFTGCAINPSYDTSLSVGERLSDYMGKFHIVLHGVIAHEPYYLDCGNKPDERCDDREKKALIEFVSLLVAEERERVRLEIESFHLDVDATFDAVNSGECVLSIKHSDLLCILGKPLAEK